MSADHAMTTLPFGFAPRFPIEKAYHVLKVIASTYLSTEKISRVCEIFYSADEVSGTSAGAAGTTSAGAAPVEMFIVRILRI